jgi:hypothetical protein
MPAAATVPTRIADAVGRVLDIDPDVLRADTPLADLGADPVAVIAMVDLLVEADHWSHRSTSLETAPIATVGDLARFVR